MNCNSHGINPIRRSLKEVPSKPLIFERLSFTWQGSGIYSLIGENGAGKSTLFS